MAEDHFHSSTLNLFSVDVLESILVTRYSLPVADRVCLSFTRFFFFSSSSFLWISSLLVSCFHAMAEMKEGRRQGESARKEQGQFQTAQRPGSELMCSSREEPHCPGSRKPEQTQLL